MMMYQSGIKGGHANDVTHLRTVYKKDFSGNLNSRKIHSNMIWPLSLQKDFNCKVRFCLGRNWTLAVRSSFLSKFGNFLRNYLAANFFTGLGAWERWLLV
jgi:hypothetical protein